MNQNQNLKQRLPKEDRPYEKCRKGGPQALSNTELLAVILRSGMTGRSALELASDVLRRCTFDRSLTGILHLTMEELCGIPGIGEVKAAQILCIGELSKRLAERGAYQRLSFDAPDTIADYYMERLRHEEREHVLCMMLDTKNHFLGDEELSSGTVNLSLISPREIFLRALARHAVNLILVHNHPSGDAEPSTEDIQITRRVRSAGELIGITLLDHIIIGDRCYTSLREQRLGFS